MERPLSFRSIDRRRLLQTLSAGALIGTSGCLRQTRSVINRSSATQLSLSIATVPADVDRESVMIARQFADALGAVGIDASIQLYAAEEFPRRVMINHDFDCCVARHPGDWDPDFLYEALHSSFAGEAGWQNPFGFTNLAFDDLLEAQRELDGEARREAVGDLLSELATEQPFVPLCIPREQRLVREDRFTGWDRAPLWGRLGYLRLEAISDGEGSGETEGTELRAVTTDPRPTENLNPLSAEYRDREPFVDLVYDSLAVHDGEQLQPWAGTWEWDEEAGDEATGEEVESEDEGDSEGEGNESAENGGPTAAPTAPTTATVTLRPDLTWHDGTDLTADDVAFTYRFLRDTSLGESEPPAHAPRFRSHGLAFTDLEVLDHRTVRFTTQTGQEAAERAFTVPLLPEHIWRERAETARVRGIITATDTTRAMVTDNFPAIGSGPFQFVDRSERDFLTLERFDDHFTLEDAELPAATVDQITTRVSPRSASAIEGIEAGTADVTTSTLEAYSIEAIADSADVRLLESPSEMFYYLGFNTRRRPLGNPYFRRTVGRLLDKAWLAETVFEGYAEPTATPLSGGWVPAALQWDGGGDGSGDGDDGDGEMDEAGGTDPVAPFFGTDGQLDVAAARAAFERAGFAYDDSGRLLVRG